MPLVPQYFGEHLVALAAASPFGGMLRAQPVPKTAATYKAVTPAVSNPAGSSSAAGGGFRHSSLGLDFYAHMSSPIRRFSDLCNQHAAFGTLDPAVAVAPVEPAGATGEAVARHAAAAAGKAAGKGEGKGAGKGAGEAESQGQAFSAKKLAETMEALNARVAEIANYHSNVTQRTSQWRPQPPKPRDHTFARSPAPG